MRIAIVGSRGYTHLEPVAAYVRALLHGTVIERVTSGEVAPTVIEVKRC